MKVLIDPDKCKGDGSCVDLCPSTSSKSEQCLVSPRRLGLSWRTTMPASSARYVKSTAKPGDKGHSGGAIESL